MIVSLQNEWLKLHSQLRLLWVGILALVISAFSIQNFFETALRVYSFWSDNKPGKTFAFFVYQQVDITLSFLQFLLACLVTVMVFDTETSDSLLRMTRLLPVSGWKPLLAKLILSMLLLIVVSGLSAGLLAVLQTPFLSYMNPNEQLGWADLARHYSLKALFMFPVLLLSALITTRFFGKPLASITLSFLSIFLLFSLPILPYGKLFRFSAVSSPSFDFVDLIISFFWVGVLGWLLKKRFV